MITLNEQIQYFQDFADDHLQLKGSFGFGNMFEINGEVKPGHSYYLLWVVPIDITNTEQTKQRRFLAIVAGLVKSDLTNRDEVWSDTEQIMDDLIKKIRFEENEMDIVGDPLMTPVSEKFGDWVTGWQCELAIETIGNNNTCDIPTI